MLYHWWISNCWYSCCELCSQYDMTPLWMLMQTALWMKETKCQNSSLGLCVELERNLYRGGMITLHCNVLGCHVQHNNQSNYTTMIVSWPYTRCGPGYDFTQFPRPSPQLLAVWRLLWWGLGNETVFFPFYTYKLFSLLLLSPCTRFLLPSPFTGSFLIPGFDRLGSEWEWYSLPPACHLPAWKPHLS